MGLIDRYHRQLNNNFYYTPPNKLLLLVNLLKKYEATFLFQITKEKIKSIFTTMKLGFVDGTFVLFLHLNAV